MHLHDVGVAQRLQDLSLDEDGIYIADRPNILSFYDLNSEELVGLLVSCQVDLPEASLTKQLHHFVLCEATGWVELIPLRGIQHGPVFHIIKVILEAF